MIVTSRSAVVAYQACPRRRYWQYEAENGTGTPGWERRRLAIPLVTGIYVHEGLERALKGESATEAARHARAAYLEEVRARGLAVEEGTDEGAVVEEQAAHVEALVLAWCRVRLPKWLEEYEVVEVEVEDRVPLSEDVTLAVRADVIVRRRYDHRMFVVNFKTVAQADERWIKSWEVDMQLMTELLAAERRHGQVFGGVIIEGLVKGRRTKETDNVGTVTGYRDSTPLLYGYKCDANPPFTNGEYAWEYTRRKGWYRFPVWKEKFTVGGSAGSADEATQRLGVQDTVSNISLGYWIDWLPQEVVEGCFTIVPPIMRDEARIASKVRQIVEMERTIQTGLIDVAAGVNGASLDTRFPQNEHSCIYPSTCACYDLCFTSNVADDPGGSGLYHLCFTHGVADDPGASGLYQPRVDQHKPMKDEGTNG